MDGCCHVEAEELNKYLKNWSLYDFCSRLSFRFAPTLLGALDKCELEKEEAQILRSIQKLQFFFPLVTMVVNKKRVMA
jgi:hypothetical protein